MKNSSLPADASWKVALETQLTASESQLFSTLVSPAAIQAFLNTVPYSEDHFYRCPLQVLRERKAHCFDGALFAALALRLIGFPPLLLELVPNARDDDHILVIFKTGGFWGAVAQSNFTGLRYRDPVYRSLRELVMSYFEDFINSAGEKTLRGYRGPIHLKTFDHLDWMKSDSGLDRLSDAMDRYQVHPVMPGIPESSLTNADERSIRGALYAANPNGLFKLPE